MSEPFVVSKRVTIKPQKIISNIEVHYEFIEMSFSSDLSGISVSNSREDGRPGLIKWLELALQFVLTVPAGPTG